MFRHQLIDMLYHCGLHLLPFDTFDILESVASSFFPHVFQHTQFSVVIHTTDIGEHLVRALYS